MSFLDRKALEEMGFASLGNNVFISELASFHNCSQIEIGSNVRIDDFCVLSAGEGGISLGDYVHVAVYSSLIGAGRIVLSDFSNLSSRVSVYSSSDDFTGEAMTNPMVSEEFTNVKSEAVYVGRHVIIGSGAVILPGVSMGDGVAIGALSLVNKNCKPFSIYTGVPVKFLRERKRDLLEIEKQFLSVEAQGVPGGNDR